MRVRLQEGDTQLLDRPAFDLAHALLRDAEFFAQRFKRGSALAQTPLPDDPKLALVQGAALPGWVLWAPVVATAVLTTAAIAVAIWRFEQAEL